jgi:hypothetical protein
MNQQRSKDKPGEDLECLHDERDVVVLAADVLELDK